MKHLFTFLLVAISATSFAQGNLQFNQVVESNFSGSYIGRFTSGSVTVPAGKVWKIEHAGLMNYSNTPPVPANSSGDHLAIGNYLVYVPASRGSADLPLWLGPGSYSVTGSLSASSPQPCEISISAIEFNIVP